MTFLLKVIVTTFAVVIGAYIMPGVHVDSFLTAIVVAFVLGLLNGLLKPVLVVLTLPVTVFSLGLFLIVINAFLIMLTDYFVSGFDVKNFWIAAIFSILLAIINGLLEMPVKSKERRR